VIAGALRIAGSTSISPVEGQEMRGLAGQPGGHVHLIRINRKVDEGASLELEEEICRIAIDLILMNGIPPCLACHGILELCRGHRNTVQGQGHIHCIAVAIRIADLTGDSQEVVIVEPPGIRIHPARRREVGSVELLAETLKSMPQDGQASFVVRVQGLAQVVQQGLFGFVPPEAFQIPPLLGLGLLDEVDHVPGKEPSFLVEGIAITLLVSPHLGQMVLDGGLKGLFCVLARHQTTSVATCRSIVSQLVIAPCRSLSQ